MPYCTTAHFSEAFGASELADLTGEDSHTFERSEADAAGMIDGYLASRYTLPLASVPAIVTGWALDITRYQMYLAASTLLNIKTFFNGDSVGGVVGWGVAVK